MADVTVLTRMVRMTMRMNHIFLPLLPTLSIFRLWPKQTTFPNSLCAPAIKPPSRTKSRNKTSTSRKTQKKRIKIVNLKQNLWKMIFASKKVLLRDDFDKCWMHLMNWNGSLSLSQWKFSKFNFKRMEGGVDTFTPKLSFEIILC